MLRQIRNRGKPISLKRSLAQLVAFPVAKKCLAAGAARQKHGINDRKLSSSVL